jgi:hypothetical protein
MMRSAISRTPVQPICEATKPTRGPSTIPVKKKNLTMKRYLKQGIFNEYPNYFDLKSCFLRTCYILYAIHEKNIILKAYHFKRYFLF